MVVLTVLHTCKRFCVNPLSGRRGGGSSLRHRVPLRRWIRIPLACLAALATAKCRAAPNGYTQIPIAKVFADGVASLSIAATKDGQKTTVYTSQYGISNRFEVGMDYQAEPTSNHAMVLNTKYLLVHRPGRLPDIACGLQNVGRHQLTVPYIVGTTQPAAWGGSLGVIRSGRDYDLMGGVAYTPSPTFQAVADYIRGRANYGTLGFIASLSPRLTLNAAYAWPNGGGNPHGYVFNLAYTFHLIRGRPQQPGPGNKNPAPAQGGTQGGAPGR